MYNNVRAHRIPSLDGQGDWVSVLEGAEAGESACVNSQVMRAGQTACIHSPSPSCSIVLLFCFSVTLSLALSVSFLLSLSLSVSVSDYLPRRSLVSSNWKKRTIPVWRWTRERRPVLSNDYITHAQFEWIWNERRCRRRGKKREKWWMREKDWRVS